jgi:hypothetical protein
MLNTSHRFSHCHCFVNFIGNMQLPERRPATSVKASPPDIVVAIT